MSVFSTYGALYSWDAVKTQKLSPTGWHIPTKEDWEKLINFLKNSHIGDKKLGEIPGFNAVSGGYFLGGHFCDIQSCGLWWSSSQLSENWPIVFKMCSNYDYPETPTQNLMTFCFVRCLKNDGSEQFYFPSNSNYIPSPVDNGKKETTDLRVLSTEINNTVKDSSIPSQVDNGKKKTSSIMPIVYGEVKDIDGNIYKTVKIGSQDWMAENLKVTKFNDGTSIPFSTKVNWKEWSNPAPAYCWYDDNETANKSIYGALYNWYAVNTSKLCPIGWHVPSDDEWNTLTTFLGGWEVAGGKLKETGSNHWKSPNASATNETGFTALPGGMRSNTIMYNLIGESGLWWSSTDSSANSKVLGSSFGSVAKSNNSKFRDLSIRCLKDN